MKKIYILNNIIIPIISLFFFAFLLGSCKKQQEWLEIKPNLNNITPERINEFQALLDFESNYTSKGLLTVVSAAPFSLTDAEYNAISAGVDSQKSIDCEICGGCSSRRQKPCQTIRW